MKLGELLAPRVGLWARPVRPAGSVAVNHAGVRQILRGLPEGWFVFGNLGDRIDRTVDSLIVGPAGAFCVTQIDHDGSVRFDRDGLALGEQRSALPSKAMLEARRAARLLFAASGRSVGVRPVLVINAGECRTDSCSPDITVLRPGELLGWFRRHPPVLSRETVAALAGAAHRPETWA